MQHPETPDLDDQVEAQPVFIGRRATNKSNWRP
jgi:hypothetical protein